MKTMDINTRINVQNIAFLTDLSEASYAALPYAANFAKLFRAKIWGFHVARAHAFPGRPYLEVPTLEKDIQEATRELSVELWKRLEGISHEVSIVEHGDTWEALSSFINKNRIDMLVMATHGRGGLGKAVLGSVAEAVFRQCQCPVLTVGPKAVMRPDQGVEANEILHATDFTHASRAATPYAISLAEENQAHLVLLHVIEPPKAGELAYGGEFVGATRQLLHDLVPPGVHLWRDPEGVVKFGSPADVILEVAQERNSNFIVLGVRKPEGNLGLATHFGRATAYKVVCQAMCPVLTVRG